VCVSCQLRTRVGKFVVNCGHTSKLRTSAVYKSPILWLCLGLVGLGSAGLVWLALELVLGLMSSVDMKHVCMCVCA